MPTGLIVMKEYCLKSHIEPSFIGLLAEEGLIEILLVKGIEHLKVSQLPDLERYIRWYYDLSINIAGIDVIRHLLFQINLLQKEISLLRRQMSTLS